MVLKYYKNLDLIVFNDVKVLFDLNKNILFKGLIGLGKMKLVEILSEVVDIFMY